MAVVLYSCGLLVTGVRMLLSSHLVSARDLVSRLLCMQVGNSIYFKRMTNHMPNYPFFLRSLFSRASLSVRLCCPALHCHTCAVHTVRCSQVINVVYLPIFFGLVEYEKRFTD